MIQSGKLGMSHIMMSQLQQLAGSKIQNSGLDVQGVR
jgi:hypothetical protein